MRDLLEEADPGWLVLATLLEGLSFASYVAHVRADLLHRPQSAAELADRRLRAGDGLAHPGERRRRAGPRAPGSSTAAAWTAARIARRSVAFFLIKSGVNFLAVAVIGAAMALGLFGPDLSLWLTALPAAAAVLVIGAVALLPRLGPGRPPGPDASRLQPRRQPHAAAR